MFQKLQIKLLKKIDEQRHLKGWSVTQLCKKANISFNTYNRWMIGENAIGIDRLTKLSLAVGLKPSISLVDKNSNLEETSKPFSIKSITVSLPEDDSSLKLTAGLDQYQLIIKKL